MVLKQIKYSVTNITILNNCQNAGRTFQLSVFKFSTLTKKQLNTNCTPKIMKVTAGITSRKTVPGTKSPYSARVQIKKLLTARINPDVIIKEPIPTPFSKENHLLNR